MGETRTGCVRSANAGINTMMPARDTRPSKACMRMANTGWTALAVAPMRSEPNGPVPMAKLSTPRALPRISSRAANITRVDCIAPNPAVPKPRKNKAGRGNQHRSPQGSEALSRLQRPHQRGIHVQHIARHDRNHLDIRKEQNIHHHGDIEGGLDSLVSTHIVETLEQIASNTLLTALWTLLTALWA